MSKLQQIKDEYARELGAEDFQDSKRHFELGIGISKLVDEFTFMDEVCRRYADAFVEWAARSGWQYYPGTQKWRNGIDPARTSKDMHDHFLQP